MTTSDIEKFPSPSEADSFIARKMANLSMKDREQFLFELHGVQEAVQETPEIIEKSLRELDLEMERLESKEAYEMAKAMNPGYVMNRDFRLKFLRAERFQARKAALRFSRYFEQKLKLFGKEKLGRDILQDDLDEHTLKLMYGGEYQIVSVRDRAGRAVGVFFPSLAPDILEEKDCLAKVTTKTVLIEKRYRLYLSILHIVCLFFWFATAPFLFLWLSSFVRGRGYAEKWHSRDMLCCGSISQIFPE